MAQAQGGSSKEYGDVGSGGRAYGRPRGTMLYQILKSFNVFLTVGRRSVEVETGWLEHLGA